MSRSVSEGPSLIQLKTDYFRNTRKRGVMNYVRADREKSIKDVWISIDESIMKNTSSFL